MMELCYLNQPLPKTDRRLFLLVFLATLGVTFAVWEFPVYLVGTAIAVLFVAGVYHLPEFGIGVLVNGLGLAGYLARNVEASGFVIPIVIVLYLPALTHYVLNHRLKWKFGMVPGLVLFIGLMLFIGILYSPLPAQGLTKAGKYLATNLFIFFAIMLFIDDIKRLKNLLKIIAVLGFVATAISIGYIAYAGVGNINRFALPAQNPIWFARGLGISLLATLFLFALAKKRFEKFIYVSFISIMLFLIYITASRGPILALLASLSFYFLLLPTKGFSFFKKLFFILVIFLSLRFSVAIAPEHMWNRVLGLFSGFDLTTLHRLRAFEMAKDLFFDNPLKGVGTAGFGQFSALSHPHNTVLELASELGIWGGLAFVSLVFCTAYFGIKLLRNKKVSFLELNLNKAFFAIFILVLINSQISGAVYGNYELWFAIGGIWTLYCSQSKHLRAR